MLDRTLKLALKKGYILTREVDRNGGIVGKLTNGSHEIITGRADVSGLWQKWDAVILREMAENDHRKVNS